MTSLILAYVINSCLYHKENSNSKENRVKTRGKTYTIDLKKYENFRRN